MNNYTYNGKQYEIEIIRKNNKNTYIRVRNQKIVVTTNYLVSTKKIEALINENKDFINNALNKSISKEENKSFKLFGTDYDIVYGFPSTEIENTKIYTKDEKMLNKDLSKYIYKTNEEKLNYWYNIFEENIPTPNLKIRKMTSRWGVCNIKNKNITLNLELSKYPVECLEYVIIHELSHFIHPNHSSSFWSLVSKYCPKYKEIRKSLKSI